MERVLGRGAKLFASALVVAAGVVVAFAANPWPIKAAGFFIALVSGLIGLRDEIVSGLDRRANTRLHDEHKTRIDAVSLTGTRVQAIQEAQDRRLQSTSEVALIALDQANKTQDEKDAQRMALLMAALSESDPSTEAHPPKEGE